MMIASTVGSSMCAAGSKDRGLRSVLIPVKCRIVAAESPKLDRETGFPCRVSSQKGRGGEWRLGRDGLWFI